jgi:CheY-like chemotaxis protein/HPt (histidine-containing phosphotransfer) domain-containing protein
VLRLLEKLGYRAEAVADGEEALTAFRTGRFDLILMDCQMPRMDGYESTRRIRALDSTIPIIALTAHALRGDEKKCREAGMNDYLAKPINFRQLESTLLKWLNNQKPRAISVLDHRYIASLSELNMDGKPELFPELAEYFFESAPEKIRSLKKAAEEKNAGLVRSTAHSFKSTCYNVGARQLALVCEEIEETAAERWPAAFENLEKEFLAAVSELQGLLKRKPIAA